jgi:formylglycine-generating enzyme required for sulfatase activity
VSREWLVNQHSITEMPQFASLTWPGGPVYMDGLTPAYLANLAANLSAALLAVLGRRLRTALAGDEAVQALERSLHTALVALLAQAGAASPDEEALLADIFADFLQQEEALREMDALLRGKGWDVEELALLFADRGYDAGTLPGVAFERAMNTFAAAFLSAAAAEKALQGTLQTDHLMAQTRLQQALLDEMRQLIAFLRDAAGVTIRAGVIQATNVVSGTQIVYQWPGSLPGSSDALWESHYLRTLLVHCDALDLAAIDEAYLPDDGTAGVRLSDVFTPLYLEHGGQLVTRRPQEATEQALARILQPEKHDGPAEQRLEREEETPVPAVAATAALPRLVILGYPGGGKSTLVNYLAAQLAARRLGQTADADALPGWPEDARPLPVRIVLRRFAAALPERVLPDELPGLVWHYIEKQMADWGCTESFDALKRTLLDEGGVILFDGLDEVRETDADTRRSLIKEAIIAFAAPLEKCRVVVTCRDYAYKSGDAWRLPPATFPAFSLSLFQPEQIEQFTQTWYQKVGPLKGWTEVRSRDEAGKLFGAVQMYAHLRELAQYPLLLTLMAHVHGRDGFLPEDRADLYERAVKLLLAHWENRLVRDVEGGRQVEPGLVIPLGVPVAVLRRALARVAFAAHERQELEPERGERTADIHRLDLQEELKAELGSLDIAETVIRYIQQRAGLLQERDRYTYTFPHRTFQEYLAAAHIWQQTVEDPVLMLKERVDRDPVWWREVFLLAAGIQKETPTMVGTLISELLYAEPPESGMTLAQATRALLAGQAVQDTGLARQIAPEIESRLTTIYERTRTWLLAIMGAGTIPARERAAAGRILGRRGDPRPGVGVNPSTGLLGMAWGKEVPAGTYTIGDNKATFRAFKEQEVTIEHPFRLSRYPITYAQFQCFVKAEDFDDPRWWAGMPEEAEDWQQVKYPIGEIREQAFPYANHPRESVSWYQAVAFCRWLSNKLEMDILLPHDYEWETAARYPDGRIYPWGNVFDVEKANTHEGEVGQTTAVGIYPAGRNSDLDLYDLSGNVWEWCRNKYDNSDDDHVDGSGDWRVLRGGSWNLSQGNAPAACRNYGTPDLRTYGIGFRVVVRRPSSHLDL